MPDVLVLDTATPAVTAALDGLAVAPGRLVVVTDALRREVYRAVYDDGARVLGPEVDRPAELAAGRTRSSPAGRRR